MWKWPLPNPAPCGHANRAPSWRLKSEPALFDRVNLIVNSGMDKDSPTDSRLDEPIDRRRTDSLAGILYNDYARTLCRLDYCLYLGRYFPRERRKLRKELTVMEPRVFHTPSPKGARA